MIYLAICGLVFMLYGVFAGFIYDKDQHVQAVIIGFWMLTIALGGAALGL